MVYYSTVSALDAAYQHHIGKYDHLNGSHSLDTDLALEMAVLRPGESVLEIGTASGRLIASAKGTVGSGVCVGVDAVQGFLDVDVPFTLGNAGLTVHPAGAAAKQVHLMCASVTASNFVNRLHALPGTPQKYDCIFALHVLNTIPPHERLPTLRMMRRLLSPSGRIVVDVCARFSQGPPLASEAALPDQFRTTPDYLDAPGSLVLLSTQAQQLATVPQGPPLPRKVPIAVTQLSPNQLWVVARQQASRAAEHAGLYVAKARDIGKGDLFNFPVGGRSPPLSQLETLTPEKIALEMSGRVQGLNAYHCAGRAWEVATRLQCAKWDSMSPEQRNYELVNCLLYVSQKEINRIRQDHENFGTQQSLEPVHLAVLAVLRQH